MASISTDKDGVRTIYFMGADIDATTQKRSRYKIRLGKLPEADAKSIEAAIDKLILFKKRNRPYDRDTDDWLTRQPNDIYDKLAAAGYATPRIAAVPAVETKTPATLKAFLDSYIAKRTGVKAATAIVYGHTRRCLVECFGADRPLNEITKDHADNFRDWLSLKKNDDNSKDGGQGLSENTVRRRCGIAKQFFRAAVRRRLIAENENPFGDMKGMTVGANKKRDFYIDRTTLLPY